MSYTMMLLLSHCYFVMADTEAPIPDSFTIGSVNAQTTLGILQVILVPATVLGAYIFYKKPDTARVKKLRKELEGLREEHKKLRKEEPRWGELIFGSIFEYLVCGNTDHIRNDEELLIRAKFFKELFSRRMNDEYSSDHESD